jgi:outer membrane receptor protein involved in Fe transport
MPSALIVSVRKFAGWAGVFTLMLAAHAVHAQAPAPPDPAAQTTPTTPAASADSDETVAINQFQVSAAPAHGYSASETMSGSRINTKIIDLPYSTVNLTDQFFKDFGINLLNESMTQIGGLTGLSIGGNFVLRGFSSTSQLRDGFYRLGRYGESDIDRIEVIRGPNAAIYGRTSPGGMVNFVSLQPSKENTQDIFLLNGGYDQRQERLGATGSLDAAQKTYYVISLDQTERRFDGQFDHIRNSEDFVAIRHDFSDNSHLSAQAEYFLQIQHAPQASAPAIYVTRTPTPDNTASTHAIGYDTALAGINAYGPNSELNRGMISYTTEYDKAFNDVWSLRVGANDYRSRRWEFNDASNPWPAVTLNAAGVPAVETRTNPTKGLIQEDGGGVQADLLAHYFFLHQSVENNSLLTMDFNDYYRYDPTWLVTKDAAFNAWTGVGQPAQQSVTLVPVINKNGQLNYIPAGPIPYYNEGFVWGGETLNTLTRRRTTSVGGNLKQQMYFFHGRLITFAGLRYDAVRFNQRDYTVFFPDIGYPGMGRIAPGLANTNGVSPGVVNGTGQVRRYFHETKPDFGFNLKVTDTVHLYGSYSQSYFVDQTSRPAAIAGWTSVPASTVNGVTEPAHFVPAPFQPQTAWGYDYGVKVSMFDERLNASLGGYYAAQANVVVTDTVLDPSTNTYVPISRSDGNQVDKGAEFDLNWLPIDNLSLTVSAATVNAKYTNFGSAYPEVVGRSVNYVSPENGSAAAKYTFSHGPANGLDLEALVTYVSSTPSEAPNAGDSNIVNGVALTHTDQWTLHTPSSTLWDFGVHYVLPWQWHHIQQIVGFVVHNAFNVYSTQYGALSQFTNTLADSRTFIVTYEIAHF